MASSRSSSGTPKRSAASAGELKRIVVGPSSRSPNISAYRRYRVRIGQDWYEGFFTNKWFGWNFENFGNSGMQLNLLDEVFELPAIRRARWHSSASKPS